MPPGSNPQLPEQNPSPAWQGNIVTRLFSALTNRDFRLILTGNAIASLSFSMEMLAQGWLVLETTDSPLWVGIAAGLRGVGLVAFGAIGGVLADRFNRRNALLATQNLRGITLLILGLLITTNHIELWHILVGSLFQGTLQGVFLPANNGLFYDSVGRGQLLNAMSARLAVFNLNLVFGPILASTLIVNSGIGSCYITASLVLIISSIPILFVRTRNSTKHIQNSVWKTLIEGLNYTRRNKHLRTLLLLSLLMEMFGFSYIVMLPVIARDVLDVGVSGLGLLQSAGGIGALVGTISVASLGDFKAKATILAITSSGAGIGLIFFALSPWFATSLIMAFLVGATIMAYDATMATILQLLSSDEMRGRVLGIYGLTFGFTPLGGFISGSIATIISAPFAIGMGGIIIVAYVGLTLTRKSQRDSAYNPHSES